MWKVLPGIVLSLLPRRWRARFPVADETIPWAAAAILAGMLESIFAVVALVYWYSHSVTHWAATALDSALNNGPTADYDPHVLGLTAFVIWCIHPLTWLLASFFAEGLIRIVAAVSMEQILPLWPLAFADWAYGKFTRRPLEGVSLHTPPANEQLRSFAATVKQSAKAAGLKDVPDQLIEATQGVDAILEIHSSRPKNEWVPPKIVRIHDAYFRLESAQSGQRPRPFVYRLRKLAAGVPGRSVLLYPPPHTSENDKP